tara:strand:- start:66 stop:581 length:516 start_codon:yes stop_codon:yes gene_type:complete
MRVDAGGNVGIGTASPAKKLDVNGDVNISSTTAGASNAGALVIAGGISAGNTGSAASYFGGSVQIANAIISQSGNSAFITGPITAGAFLTLQSGNTTGGINFRDSAGNSVGQYYQVTDAWSFDKPTTFAGAVSITGNIGFYGQAATAKPTGVAVTAAAIHAALVTLNLIAP